MAELLDDVSYLSEEVGPRPAGTEEEQQAALYIADKVHQRTGFHAEIEDINCMADAELIDLIYFAVAFICLIVAFFLPVTSIVMLVLSLVAAVLYYLERMQKRPVLARLLTRDISQNVVVKYKPGTEAARMAQPRKIVVVANYDSGRVRRDVRPRLVGITTFIARAAAGSLIATPILILLRNIILAGSLGVVNAICSLVCVVALVFMGLQIALLLLHRFSSFNEAANNNASSIAVMLEVLRRIDGTAAPENAPHPRASAGEGAGPTVHGAEAARAADVVPEGADLTYDKQVSPDGEDGVDDAGYVNDFAPTADADGQEVVRPAARVASRPQWTAEPDDASAEDRLRSAKAAIAALTGEAVDDEVFLDLGSEEDASHSAPAVSAAAEAPAAPSPVVEPLADDVQSPAAFPVEAPAAPVDAQLHPSSAPEPVSVPEPPAVSARSTVPDWFLAAQAKAHRAPDAAPARRSRYADAPATAFDESDSSRQAPLVDKETEDRIRQMRESIAVGAPEPVEAEASATESEAPVPVPPVMPVAPAPSVPVSGRTASIPASPVSAPEPAPAPEPVSEPAPEPAPAMETLWDSAADASTQEPAITAAFPPVGAQGEVTAFEPERELEEETVLEQDKWEAVEAEPVQVPAEEVAAQVAEAPKPAQDEDEAPVDALFELVEEEDEYVDYRDSASYEEGEYDEDEYDDYEDGYYEEDRSRPSRDARRGGGFFARLRDVVMPQQPEGDRYDDYGEDEYEDDYEGGYEEDGAYENYGEEASVPVYDEDEYEDAAFEPVPEEDAYPPSREGQPSAGWQDPVTAPGYEEDEDLEDYEEYGDGGSRGYYEDEPSRFASLRERMSSAFSRVTERIAPAPNYDDEEYSYDENDGYDWQDGEPAVEPVEEAYPANGGEVAVEDGYDIPAEGGYAPFEGEYIAEEDRPASYVDEEPATEDVEPSPYDDVAEEPGRQPYAVEAGSSADARLYTGDQVAVPGAQAPEFGEDEEFGGYDPEEPFDENSLGEQLVEGAATGVASDAGLVGESEAPYGEDALAEEPQVYGVVPEPYDAGLPGEDEPLAYEPDEAEPFISPAEDGYGEDEPEEYYDEWEEDEPEERRGFASRISGFWNRLVGRKDDTDLAEHEGYGHEDGWDGEAGFDYEPAEQPRQDYDGEPFEPQVAAVGRGALEYQTAYAPKRAAVTMMSPDAARRQAAPAVEEPQVAADVESEPEPMAEAEPALEPELMADPEPVYQRGPVEYQTAYAPRRASMSGVPAKEESQAQAAAGGEPEAFIEAPISPEPQAVPEPESGMPAEAVFEPEPMVEPEPVLDADFEPVSEPEPVPAPEREVASAVAPAQADMAYQQVIPQPDADSDRDIPVSVPVAGPASNQARPANPRFNLRRRKRKSSWDEPSAQPSKTAPFEPVPANMTAPFSPVDEAVAPEVQAVEPEAIEPIVESVGEVAPEPIAESQGEEAARPAPAELADEVPAGESAVASEPAVQDESDAAAAEEAAPARDSVFALESDYGEDDLSGTIAMAPIDVNALREEPAAASLAEELPIVDADEAELEEPDGEQRMRLPEIPLGVKQHAPLAQASGEEGGKVAAKSRLSTMIPKIDVAAPPAPPAEPDGESLKDQLASPSRTERMRRLRTNLPSMSGTIGHAGSGEENSLVSQTGSFAAVSATGNVDPVGDELVEDVPPEEIYVDDAEDFVPEDGGITETGAYTAPDYVQMPEKKHGFFSRRRRRKAEDEITPQEWLGVADDFDAREVGKARGDWTSFRENDERSTVGDRYQPADEQAATWRAGRNEPGVKSDYDTGLDSAFADEEDEFLDSDYGMNNGRWNGGAFSGRRSGDRDVYHVDDEDEYAEFAEYADENYDESAFLEDLAYEDNASDEGKRGRLKGLAARFSRKDKSKDDNGSGESRSSRRGSRADDSGSGRAARGRRKASSTPGEDDAWNVAAARAAARGAVMNAINDPRTQEELGETYGFVDDAIANEVWFVALGAGMSDNAGMKEFLDAHADELRGAIIISLEGVGDGELVGMSSEGVLKQFKPTTRMKRFLRNAGQATGIRVGQEKMNWRDSAATVAMRRGYSAITVAGVDDGIPARYASSDDVADKLEEGTLKQRVNFMLELLRTI